MAKLIDLPLGPKLILSFLLDGEGLEIALAAVSPQSKLKVTHDEYQLYSTLFSVSDVKNSRKMCPEVLSSLMLCSGLTTPIVDRLMEFVRGKNDVFEIPLNLEDWIVSKYIVYLSSVQLVCGFTFIHLFTTQIVCKIVGQLQSRQDDKNVIK